MGITSNLDVSLHRTFCVALGVTLLLACSFQSLPADILLDDHFDNGDIATGGTNGGFVEIGNAQEADVEITESGSIATIEFFSIQANPNKGMTEKSPKRRISKSVSACFDGTCPPILRPCRSSMKGS